MSSETATSKGERTRQAVITAAHQLFVEKGFAGTSMRDISERAGLALGGIYNHFPTKESIFSEVLIAKHPFNQVFPLLVAAPGESVEEFVPSAAKSLQQVRSYPLAQRSGCSRQVGKMNRGF